MKTRKLITVLSILLLSAGIFTSSALGATGPGGTPPGGNLPDAKFNSVTANSTTGNTLTAITSAVNTAITAQADNGVAGWFKSGTNNVVLGAASYAIQVVGKTFLTGPVKISNDLEITGSISNPNVMPSLASLPVVVNDGLQVTGAVDNPTGGAGGEPFKIADYEGLDLRGPIKNTEATMPVIIDDPEGLNVKGGTDRYAINLKVDGRIKSGDSTHDGGMWTSDTNFVGQAGNAIGFWNTDNWKFLVAQNLAGFNVPLSLADDKGLNVSGTVVNSPFSVAGGIANLNPSQRVIINDPDGLAVPGTLTLSPFSIAGGIANLNPSQPVIINDAEGLAVNGPLAVNGVIGLTGNLIVPANIEVKGNITNTGASGPISLNDPDGIIVRDSTTAKTALAAYPNGSPIKLTVYGDGYSNGGTWRTSSDIRLKTNVQPLESALNKVKQLNGVYFNWKTDPDKNKQIGFIAQDVEKVIPEVVSKDDQGYLGLAYGNFTALLSEAIKDLDKIVEKLGTRVDTLETKVNQLQQENADLKVRLEMLETKLN